MTADLTQLLNDAAAGDADAREAALRAVHDGLHALARAQLARSHRDVTLQPTMLISETYLRLFGSDNEGWNNRGHFMALAARAMRQISVDFARRRLAEKRGGSWGRVELSTLHGADAVGITDLLDLEDALGALAEVSPRQAEIVEMRFFGGMEIEEIGVVLGVSRRTVQLDWRTARAWLRAQLASDEGDA